MGSSSEAGWPMAGEGEKRRRYGGPMTRRPELREEAPPQTEGGWGRLFTARRIGQTGPGEIKQMPQTYHHRGRRWRMLAFEEPGEEHKGHWSWSARREGKLETEPLIQSDDEDYADSPEEALRRARLRIDSLDEE